jgi:hypothetical protein
MNGGANVPKGAAVLAIGGVPVGELAAVAMAYSPTPNSAAEETCIEELLLRESFHKHLIKTETPNHKTTITYLHKGEEKTVKAEFKLTLDDSRHYASYDTYYEEKNGTFILYLSEMFYSNALDKAVAALERSVQNGVKNVIIDVRGNGGGSPYVGEDILYTLGMKPGEYGITVYFGLNTTTNYLSFAGYLKGQVLDLSYSVNDGYNPTDIYLYTLVDRYTFSAATMFAAQTQDGALGTVIGEVSSDTPGCYGYFGTKPYKLPSSNLWFLIADTTISRPNLGAGRYELIPDIMIEPGEDAMDYALREINNANRSARTIRNKGR